MAYPKDVMDCLLEAGRGDLASKVARLVYQRAELLEALKGMVNIAETGMVDFNPHDEYVMDKAVKAITKAEAAE